MGPLEEDTVEFDKQEVQEIFNSLFLDGRSGREMEIDNAIETEEGEEKAIEGAIQETNVQEISRFNNYIDAIYKRMKRLKMRPTVNWNIGLVSQNPSKRAIRERKRKRRRVKRKTMKTKIRRNQQQSKKERKRKRKQKRKRQKRSVMLLKLQRNKLKRIRQKLELKRKRQR